MEKEKSAFSNLPPGFSKDDFAPVEIKRIKKGKKGEYVIELKPEKEKETGSDYYYIKSGNGFQILNNGAPVLTPGGNPVITASEAVVKRTVDQMNADGEIYDSAASIVCFLYSAIDFFTNRRKEDMIRDILSDFERDWTLSSPYHGSRNDSIWKNNFGTPEVRRIEVIKWLNDLPKHQVGGVFVITATMDSPNLAFILSNKSDEFNMEAFTKYCEEKYTRFQKKEGMGMYSFWPYSELIKIFENYNFWQESEIGY
jgi:hypothetical protein